jgi:4-amino-4-deoxy-L-arabinose transferase-like glycosyltransferase
VTRVYALLIITALWAAIFLPGLGAIELKGEEGRRVLPAVTMMETGDWIVPYIGGEPYLRKPPLIHWAVAASFFLTGRRDDWAARLPSALSALALAVAIIAVGSGWLTPAGALLTAIFALTNLAMLEKGRLAELEALYTSTTGIALVCWLAWWREERSPWLVWIVPFVFLGLGLLTKAPLHLLFFYAVVFGVLWHTKRLRELRCGPHFVGIVLMLAMFAAWAVPYLQAVKKLDATGVWTAEFAGRVAHSKMTLRLWIENLWNNYENILPWLLFVPLWWNRRILAAMPEKDAAIFRGLRAATALCGSVLILIPGYLSRYNVPLVVPASLLTALVLRSPDLLPARLLPVWRTGVLMLLGVAAVAAGALPFLGGWTAQTIAGLCGMLAVGVLIVAARERWREPVHLAIGTTIVVALATLIFVVVRVPRIIATEKARPLAQQINSAVPADHELYVIDPGFQPALFYVQAHCTYLDSARKLPPESVSVLIHSDKKKQLEKLGRATRELTQFHDRVGKDLVLLEVAPTGG